MSQRSIDHHKSFSVRYPDRLAPEISASHLRVELDDQTAPGKYTGTELTAVLAQGGMRMFPRDNQGVPP